MFQPPIIYKSNVFKSNAAGVLPYTVYQNKIYFLLGKENRGISDFGGYKDHNEDDEQGASREFSEETLGLFSESDRIRGCNLGVKNTTDIMTKLLKDKAMKESGYVTSIINGKNQYRMFIAPVSRWLENSDFEKMVKENDERPYHRRIHCAEKDSICWLSISDMLSLANDPDVTIKFNEFPQTLFKNFRFTISQPEFITFLNNLSNIDTEPLQISIDKFWKSNLE
ncbi:hypothetical protein DLAC_07669 [Tieghemostelium lacteum]|uniref:Nudix hydrolase domain-containing protein n=1 Tax=Tieghemostelium lacteum TaxID=361077 RepID=A0A151ZD27_TIELA|nr:hypothetical protein DLAC_07669 [Tieghemostelium lacteum]|eukprot:KYQ91858.1 hypothetical protein DLAC_07669 [Tieghemostelium lacteum]